MNRSLILLTGILIWNSVVANSIFGETQEKSGVDLGTISEKLTIKVGEQRTIHLNDPLRVTISRRGIIHLIDSGQGVWRMTGLRSGVVAIDLHQRRGEKKVVYVDVIPKPLPGKPFTSDFTATQSAVAEEITPKQFQVKAQIELIEEQISDVTGGSSNAMFSLDLLSGAPNPNLSGAFEARDRQFNKRVIGEPQFSVHEDDDAIVKSGGEALQDRVDEDGRHRDVIYEYGMSLSVKLHEQPNKQVGSDVLFVLKSPGGDQQKFSLNHIQTKTSLPYGIKTLIGSVDLASDDHGEDRDSYMAQIPIIGPLFKRKTNSSAKAVVQLWLEVKAVK